MRFEVIAGDPTTIHRDNRIPLAVRGLFGTILSLPVHWNFSVKGLAEMCTDTVPRIKDCLRVMVKFGYAKMVRVSVNGAGRVKVARFYQGGQASMMPVEVKSRVVSQKLPGFDPRPKKATRKKMKEVPVPNWAGDAMFKLCYLVETASQQSTLTSVQRNRVFSILGQLREAGADINDLAYFQKFWDGTWQSRTSGTHQYQPPRPEQVLEHWWVMVKTKPLKLDPEEHSNVLDFNYMYNIMSKRHGSK